MKKTLLIAAMGVLLGSSGISAKELNPWIDCGIGAMLFPKSEAGAAVSNVIWDWGTTAVTSAVSSKGTCAGEKAKTAFFINSTFEEVVENTANGNGEHVTAMLNILGCDSAAQSDIISSVRSEYSKTVGSDSFTTNSRVENAEAYYNVVTSTIENNYATQCSSI